MSGAEPRGRAISRPVWIAGALAFGVAAGIRIWNALTDALMWGYDAWGHVAYVLFLDLYGAIPNADQGWSYYQPPLHYVLGAVLARLGDGAVLMRGLSLLGGAASLGIAGLAAWVARAELARRPELALVAFCAVAFLPVHFTVGNMPGNEMTVAFLNGAAIAVLIANERRVRTSFWIDASLGLVLGLAALSKHTGLVAWLAVGGSLLAGAWLAPARGAALGRGVLRAGVIAAVALAVAGPHYLHNVESYGRLIPSNRDYPLVASIEADQPPGERHLSDYLSLSPAVFTEPNPLAPHMLHSIWGSLYTNLWTDTHRESDVGRTLEAQREIRPTAVLMIFLGLLPTGLALAGGALAVRDVARGRRRALYLPLLALTLAMLAAFAVFVWIVPRWAAVKASYCLSLSLPFALFLCRGFEALGAPGLRVIRVVVAAGLAVIAIASAAIATAGFALPVRRDSPAAGAVHFYFAEYEAAARIYARLAEQTRYPAPWLENLAAIELARGQPGRARELYRTARRQADERGLSDPHREARLAVANAVAGELAVARAGLDAALGSKVAPDLLANRGAVALLEGDLSAARDDLVQAIALDPSLDAAWRHLAEVHARTGDVDATRAALLEAEQAACRVPRSYPYGVGTGEMLEWGVGRRWLLRVEDDRLVPLLPADHRARCAVRRGLP